MRKTGTIKYKLWKVTGEVEIPVTYYITFENEEDIHIQLEMEFTPELDEEDVDEMLRECIRDSELTKPYQMFDGYLFSVN